MYGVRCICSYEGFGQTSPVFSSILIPKRPHSITQLDNCIISHNLRIKFGAADSRIRSSAVFGFQIGKSPPPNTKPPVLCLGRKFANLTGALNDGEFCIWAALILIVCKKNTTGIKKNLFAASLRYNIKIHRFGNEVVFVFEDLH